MKFRLRSIALVAALTLGLAACGGSGGGESTPPPANEDPPPTENTPPTDLFTLTLSGDKLVLLQGATGSVQATVVRSAGFDGPVAVELSGLPQGVSAAPAVIAAGATTVDLVLSAEASAPHSLPTTATATGQANGKSASKPLTVTVRGLPGVVDTSFAGGAIVTPVDIGEDFVYAVAVQADGKIVVAGSSEPGATGLDFAVLRFNADGTPDASFGTDGKVFADFGSDSDRAWALLLMPDQSIVVGGETNTGNNAGGVDFALVRFSSGGAPVVGFGNQGKVITPLKSGTGTDVLRALALQTVNGEARILAVGGEGDFLAARYTDAGALDGTFAANGKVVGLFNASIGAAHAVAVLPDGEAVVAGHIGHDFAAVQLTASGQLDNRFGPAHDGRLVLPLSATNWDEATAIVRQADGKLILAGWVYSGNSSSGDFAALRLQADGQVDSSFGNAGITIKPMAASTKNDLAHAAVLQADERVPTVRAIIAGEANGSNHDVALTRLWL